MALDPRQLILLAIALAVPVTAFLLDRSRAILAWVGFTLFVQIFDTTIITNLPAGRLVGLLYLPAAIWSFRRWSAIHPTRAFLINFIYLIALGAIFGYLIPWPDISRERPFNLRAEGRSIIFLVRTLSDFSLALFVTSQLARPGAFDTLRKWMLRGAVLSSMFALAKPITGIDFYSLITGLRVYAMNDFRPRGLAFEPRGLGVACGYGMILILSKRHRRKRDWILLLIITAGLAVSSSSSALAATAGGLVVLAIVGSMRVRSAMIGGLVLIALLFGMFAVLVPARFEESREAIVVRMQGRGMVEANDPRNFAESLALRMDVFDSAASLFLIRNPRYALTGTGPGLISLPASGHVPDGLYRAVFPIIDNPPSHGILLELANTGILGVVTWVFQVIVIYAAGRRLRRYRRLPFPPEAATTAFVAGAAMYAIQVSPSPFWAVFLGIGWAIWAKAASLPAPRIQSLQRLRLAYRPPQRDRGLQQAPSPYHS